MFSSSIITIGYEILSGVIQDTNFTFIAKFLKSIGVPLLKKISVKDNIENIIEAIKYASNTDIIFLVGGLGPTDDDVTRDALAKFLNKKLIFNENQWTKIVNFLNNKNKIISESNKKQAFIIEGANFIENDNGTAPGMFYKDNNNFFFLLPGPPRENIPMINNKVFDILKNYNFIKGNFYSKVFKLYDVSESFVFDLVKNIDKKGINVGYYFVPKGWVEIHLTKFFECEDIDKFKEIEDKYIEIFNSNKIFWTEDYDLSYILYKKLEKEKLTISFAESITGGNLSANFIKTPGVSSVFKGGVVVYSNESKIKILKVRKESIEKYGAVSENVAKEMVLGTKRIFNTDISVSVTGIAGPTGNTDRKPIGLVYFGFILKDKILLKKEYFLGDRDQIINKTVNFVFKELIQLI